MYDWLDYAIHSMLWSFIDNELQSCGYNIANGWVIILPAMKQESDWLPFYAVDNTNKPVGPVSPLVYTLN